ncbi:hypothetical protein SH449x_002459 [Pirellulaceae bacterium SH449]
MRNPTKVSDDTPIESLALWKSHLHALQRANVKTAGDIRRIEDERGLLSIDHVSVGARRRILESIGDDAGISLLDDQ